MPRRAPAVAGSFYPADPVRLRDRVRELTRADRAPRRVRAVLVPHAGYDYSGRVAGETFARVEVPDRACILATNHTGQGPAFSIWPDGAWQTPLGDVPVDDGLTAVILAGCPGAKAEESAQQGEHSAEVEIPFIAFLNPSVRIAVVTVSYMRIPEAERLTRLLEFGRALGRVLARCETCPLLVASTDMSHCGVDFHQAPPPGHDADSFARAQDAPAIERMVAMSADGLYRVVNERRVTMCGWAPAVVAIEAASAMGAATAELVRYATSADVSGNRDHVVGYAGILIS